MGRTGVVSPLLSSAYLLMGMLSDVVVVATSHDNSSCKKVLYFRLPIRTFAFPTKVKVASSESEENKNLFFDFQSDARCYQVVCCLNQLRLKAMPGGDADCCDFTCTLSSFAGTLRNK